MILKWQLGFDFLYPGQVFQLPEGTPLTQQYPYPMYAALGAPPEPASINLGIQANTYRKHNTLMLQ
ncbi:MAG: hypothetical protein NC416_11930 [Eubacterium sp.]|nr:hypothetical protein [Eubacterium sp.]